MTLRETHEYKFGQHFTQSIPEAPVWSSLAMNAENQLDRTPDREHLIEDMST